MERLRILLQCSDLTKDTLQQEAIIFFYNYIYYSKDIPTGTDVELFILLVKECPSVIDFPIVAMILEDTYQFNEHAWFYFTILVNHTIDVSMHNDYVLNRSITFGLDKVVRVLLHSTFIYPTIEQLQIVNRKINNRKCDDEKSSRYIRIRKYLTIRLFFEEFVRHIPEDTLYQRCKKQDIAFTLLSYRDIMSVEQKLYIETFIATILHNNTILQKNDLYVIKHNILIFV